MKLTVASYLRTYVRTPTATTAHDGFLPDPAPFLATVFLYNQYGYHWCTDARRYTQTITNCQTHVYIMRLYTRIYRLLCRTDCIHYIAVFK